MVCSGRYPSASLCGCRGSPRLPSLKGEEPLGAN
jgi:hypothetical protein